MCRVFIGQAVFHKDYAFFYEVLRQKKIPQLYWTYWVVATSCGTFSGRDYAPGTARYFDNLRSHAYITPRLTEGAQWLMRV